MAGAYVAFVLYCNPGVPDDADSAELRRAFQTLPKSGGRAFDIFTLFTLVKKLERKELKTWAELTLALGVEPPDLTQGESAQKIQQYAVRLKVGKPRLFTGTSADVDPALDALNACGCFL